MALHMMIPKASYFLDGQESTASLEEPRPGTAKLKAKWTKDKKGLELSSFREANFGGNSVTFTTREKWTLSDEGETLKIQRSVETPMGLDTIKLTFHKVPGKPPLPQQQSARGDLRDEFHGAGVPRLVNNRQCYENPNPCSPVGGCYFSALDRGGEGEGTGEPPALIGWLDLQAGSRNISVFKEDLQKVTLHLAQGAPGTMTTGEVTFRPVGKGQEPAWKGKVDFFVFGRDNAVASVKIEKTCPGDGRGFTPLQ